MQVVSENTTTKIADAAARTIRATVSSSPQLLGRLSDGTGRYSRFPDITSKTEGKLTAVIDVRVIVSSKVKTLARNTHEPPTAITGGAPDGVVSQ